MKTNKINWGKLRSLSWTDMSFIVIAWILLPLFWLGLRAIGLAKIQQHMKKPILSALSHSPLEELKNSGKLVAIASKVALGPSTCLTRSLVLGWMLRRRKIDTKLQIGVKYHDDRLDAHAWVEYQGHPINDAADIDQRFAVLEGSSLPKTGSFS